MSRKPITSFSEAGSATTRKIYSRNENIGRVFVTLSPSIRIRLFLNLSRGWSPVAATKIFCVTGLFSLRLIRAVPVPPRSVESSCPSTTNAKSKDSPGGALRLGPDGTRFSFKHERPFREQQLFLSLEAPRSSPPFLVFSSAAALRCSVSTYASRGPFTERWIRNEAETRDRIDHADGDYPVFPSSLLRPSPRKKISRPENSLVNVKVERTRPSTKDSVVY